MNHNIEETKKQFIEALIKGERIIADEIYESLDQASLQEEMMIESMESIGRGWDKDQYSLAQIYIAGVISEELAIRHMTEDKAERGDGKIGICVLLDYHALGKKIVTAMLEASGFHVMDLGEGLSVDDIVSKTKEMALEVLMISTLMLPSALRTEEVIKKVKEDNRKVKVIVGGAPFRMDPHLWKKVKADAMGRTASDAVTVLKEMLNNG